MLNDQFNIHKYKTAYENSLQYDPFPSVLIENFFSPTYLQSIQNSFPKFEDDVWHIYDNPLEKKRSCNSWNIFPPIIYNCFQVLNSPEFVATISNITGLKLIADSGLHGGGLHVHGPGGILNPHLDYDQHPKLPLQRRINLIVYVHPKYHPSFGGQLGFWGHDQCENLPANLFKVIEPIPNSAILFDTSKNSWHGLVRPLTNSSVFYRMSLAVYYLSERQHPINGARERALYAPTESQRTSPEILELIRKRSDSTDFASAYKHKK